MTRIPSYVREAFSSTQTEDKMEIHDDLMLVLQKLEVAVASHYPDGSSCNAKQMCCQISPESYGCLSAETAVCPDDYSHFPQVTVPTPLHILSLTQAPISPRGIVGINYSNSSKLQSVVLSNIRYTIPSVTLT
ncbi:uncharacterized protein [Periplaneta americana]|uniref:uncharacterized protein isoform X5 n=1 Tax=Periplaneta americana TaxID=6978 RepID=UPI0037E97F6F